LLTVTGPDVHEPEERIDAAHAAAAESPARFRAQPGTLYVVATPLGNLRDLTLRALDILGSVDTIAAEDTRVTAVLLRHYGVAARPLSLHQHNEAHRAARLVERLREGQSVALVSDAGTPAISDPGARLVRAVRDAGLPIVPIPGASALATAVCAAGLIAERFVHLGFLPTAAKARRELLSRVANLPCALILYEAPHRVRATVDELAATLGGARELVVARELTKRFETITRVSLADAAGWFAEDPNRERGEFVLAVDAPAHAAAVDAASAELDVRRLLVALLEELPPARAARVAAAATGLPRDALYRQALEIRNAAG
jgi:16S rRNA (cytidine1402-2'-O)-methyltransferase